MPGEGFGRILVISQVSERYLRPLAVFLRVSTAGGRMVKSVSPKVVFFKSFGKSPSRIFGASEISCSLIFQPQCRKSKSALIEYGNKNKISLPLFVC